MRRLAGLAAALALWPSLAVAHPVDEVVQGAYLTLAPGEVRIELDLTPGTAVVGTVLEQLDPDGDETVSAAEAQQFGATVLGQSRLTLDGSDVPWTVASVSVPPYASLVAGDVIRVMGVAPRSDSAGPHSLAYENAYMPAKSQWTANVFLLPGGGWQYAVGAQQRSDDGRQLRVDYTIAAQ